MLETNILWVTKRKPTKKSRNNVYENSPGKRKQELTVDGSRTMVNVRIIQNQMNSLRREVRFASTLEHIVSDEGILQSS